MEIVASWGEAASSSVCARLAPNGEWLVRAEGSVLCLQQALTGRELARLAAGQAPVLCLAIAPDASWLVAGSDRQDAPFTLRVYARGEEWALVGEFEAHERTGAVAIADASLFASAGDGVVTVWSLEGGDLWSTEPGEPVAALAFSPEGDRLAVARSGHVEVWDREGTPLWRARAAGCGELAFLGERLLATGSQGLYRLHEGRVEEHVEERFLAEEPRARFGPDVWFGPGVSTAGNLRLHAEHGLELWRGPERLWRSARVEEILVTPERVLLSGGDRLSVRDREGRELAVHRSDGGLGKLSLSVRGELAGWVTNTELVVIDLTSGEVVGRSPARNLAAVVNDRLVWGKLLVHPTWRLEAEAPLANRTDLVAPKLVLTPDGEACCLAVPEGGLRRARLEDGATEQSYFWTAMPDRQAIRPPWLVAWTREAIGRWSLASGELGGITPAPSSGLGGVAVSPSGQRALTLDDGAVRLWDLERQEELGAVFLEGVAVAALDEQRYLVAGADGRVQVVSERGGERGRL